MPPDQLGQLASQIPDAQLDALHTALNSIRSGSYQGKPIDTSDYDMDMVHKAWEPIHARVTARDQNVQPQDSSLWDRVSALGHKAVDVIAGPSTYAGATEARAEANPAGGMVQAIGGPGRLANAPVNPMTPALDIQKLEAPGYAQAHPMMDAMAQGASGFTSPGNVAMQAGMAGLPHAVGTWASRVFAMQMGKGNYDQAKEFQAGYKEYQSTGDATKMWHAAGEFVVTAPFTVMSAMGSKLTPEENAGVRKRVGLPPKTPIAPTVVAGQGVVSEVPAAKPPVDSKAPQIDSQARTAQPTANSAPNYRMNAMGYIVEAPPEPEVKPEVEHQVAKVAEATSARPNPLGGKLDAKPIAERTPAEKTASMEAFLNPPREVAEKSVNEFYNGPAPKLPRELSGAKPRYGYQDKQFELQFDSDTDKALYTVAQSSKNRAHDSFMSHLREVFPNKTDAEIVDMGKRVRSSIKPLAATGDPADGPLRVPKLTAPNSRSDQVDTVLPASSTSQTSSAVPQVDASLRTLPNTGVTESAPNVHSVSSESAEGQVPMQSATLPDVARFAPTATNDLQASTPSGTSPQASISQIDNRLTVGAQLSKASGESLEDFRKRQADWATERSGLLKERAKLSPDTAAPKSPLDQVKNSLKRVVTVDKNPNTRQSRGDREAELTNLIDAHAKRGNLQAEDLSDLAKQTADKADQLTYHLDIQDAKADLQKARKDSGVQRIRTQGYAEAGEAPPEKSGMQFVDSASTARRTVLDMLGGYKLTAKRLYDAETGRVERDFRQMPLTTEESEFARDHQSQLDTKIQSAIDAKRMPSESELADMESHVTAIEAATGMKLVYSGKGSELSKFDPSRAVLNEAIGKGKNSHAAVDLDRMRTVVDRMNDAASVLQKHAERLGGSKELPQVGQPAPSLPQVDPKTAVEQAGAKYVGVQNNYGIRPDDVMFQPSTGGSTLHVPVHLATPETIQAKIAESAKQFANDTPVSTPSNPAAASPADLHEFLSDKVEEFENLPDSVKEGWTTKQRKYIEAAIDHYKQTLDDPTHWQDVPEALRQPAETALAKRKAEAGKVSPSLIGGMAVGASIGGAVGGPVGAVAGGMIGGLAGGVVDLATGWRSSSAEDITSLKGQLTDARDRLGMGLQNIASTMLDMWTDYKGNKSWGEPEEVTGKFKAAKRMVDQFRESFDKALVELIPDAKRRIAITNYIQAGGDHAILANREAGMTTASQSGTAKKYLSRFIAGYHDAQNLSPLEKAAADSLQVSYDDLWNRAHSMGVLNHFIENYVNQIYKGKKIPFGMQRVVSQIGSGALKNSPSLARQRWHDSYYQAELSGNLPANKDIGWLHSTYIDQVEKAIRGRAYVKSGLQAHDSDGRRMFAPSGVGHQISEVDVNPDVFIKPHSMRDVNVGTPSAPVYEDTHDYGRVNNPNMRSWQWMATDPVSGANTFMEGDVLVHPNYIDEARALLEPSAVRASAVGRGALKLSAGFKHIMFGVSGFHPSAMTVHGLEHGVNPFNLMKVDAIGDQTQALLAAGGLQTHDYNAEETFGKGIEGSQLLNQIPGLGQYNRKYTNWLFRDYIPRLKTTMAVEAFSRNQARYPNMSAEQVASLTADQANAAFGGLDYAKLGRSKTTEDLLHLGFIAPDFFEARTRFLGQALKPYGREQATALLRGAAVMYVGARIMNQMLDNDPHWDAKQMFSVIHNGKEYTMRSVQSDALHAVTDPLGFINNRLNPVTVKAAIEAMSGRDAQGFERGPSDQVKDFFQNTSQVAVQGYLKDPSNSAWDALRTSMGLSSHMYRTDAEQAAMKFRMAGVPRGIQGAEERTRLQLLHGARKAATAGDADGMSKLLDNGLNQGVITADDADKIFANANQEYLPQLTNGLNAENAMEVYRLATPAEREGIRDIVWDKVSAAIDTKAPIIRERIEKEASKLFEQ